MADEERRDEQQPTPPEDDAPQQGADPAGEASPADQEGAAPEAEEEAAAAEQAGAGETPAAEGAPDAEAEPTPPAAEAPGEQELAGDAEPEPAAEDASAAGDEPAAEEEAEAAEQAGTDDAPAAEGRPRRRGRGKSDSEEDLIPGAHLEPDLVLEEEQRPEGEYAEVGAAYAEDEAAPAEEGEGGEAEVAETPAREPIDLAADARYIATGKRKTAVARVILKPGEGTYTINGRHLDQFFPRVKLQRMAQQPLETAGYNNRMDVVAKIHGGGVSSQAGALRHGIARALVEADPHLRTELKRRGFLTRDPRVKERKKAGLKKARKRPQFSKR
jgi:small subunit ribosomal protein S9